jgi:hypothetical protein
VFRLEGEYWTIDFDGRTIRLRDTAGLRYLAALLRRPGEAVHASDLCAAGGEGSRGHRATTTPRRGTAERDRIAVTKAIKTALERIRGAHPTLGAHLDVTIRRGLQCRYLPDPLHPVAWRE